MILTNKINLIWYGRGADLEANCEAYTLTSDSNIEYVYRVNSSGLGWESWDSVLVDQAQKVEKLECGHLYLIILKVADGQVQSIDIPEAVLDGTLKIGDDNLQILPNNESEVEEEEEEEEEEDDNQEVEATCLTTESYKIYSLIEGELRNGEQSLTRAGTAFTTGDGFSVETKFSVGTPDNSPIPNPQDTSDQKLTFRFAVTAEAFIDGTINADAFDTDTKVRISITQHGLSSLVGCWEGTGTETFIMSRIETADDSSNQETSEDESTNEDNSEEVVTADSCFADLEGKAADHKIVFTPSDNVTINNFKLCKIGGGYGDDEDILNAETDFSKSVKANLQAVIDTNAVGEGGDGYKKFTGTVPFALYFNDFGVGSDTDKVDVTLTYPVTSEPGTKVTMERSFQAISQASVPTLKGTFVGMKVFDTNRSEENCAWIENDGFPAGTGDSV